MALKPIAAAGIDLRSLFQVGRAADLSDGRLLEQFRSGRGPAADAAFAALVERHGPMVLRVCRGVLNDEHDAQDAFQATFLVLVRRPGSIRGGECLASWLFGVALRVARKARAEAARRRSHEQRAAVSHTEDRRTTPPEGGSDAAHPAIDEEIRRLPEKYRAPVVLCFLEGLTQERAAERLGWPSGTVRGRLARARVLLRRRLERRGVALSAVAPAAVPPELLADAARTAASAVTGRVASAPVAHLAASAAPRAFGLAGTGSLVLAATALGAIACAVSSADRAPVRQPENPPRASTFSEARANDGARAEAPPPANPSTTAPARDVPSASETTAFLPDTHRDPALRPREPTAKAAPLQNITIDGDLKDWPAAMPRYPILKMLVGRDLGYGGLQNADLRTSPDLSAAFSVGYDPKEQLIYLAVIVRDDKLVVGNTSHLDTDAVEVYIDGLRGERSIPLPKAPFWEHIDLSAVPVQQYVSIPGPGKVYGSKYDTNPVLLAGDLKKTRTRMAFRRERGVTTYEWAIQPFDRYPDQPTRLVPGKRIGFDLAIADKDVPATSPQAMNEPEEDKVAWIYWGPQWADMKVLNAGHLGELVLTK
jgi:RNA polymerase sigma factor (sigma-70 family)